MNRIVKRGLIVLAVLAAVPVFLIMAFVAWFLVYTYWTADTKFDSGGTGEYFATFVALTRDPSSFFSLKHCDWNNPSMDSPNCRYLDSINRGVCRWWFGEHCQAYAVTGQFIRHSDDLGTLLHATIDPCFYDDEMRKEGVTEPWCRGEGEDSDFRRPVVLVFKKDNQRESVRIRIDFPEGFTTTAERKIRKEK